MTSGHLWASGHQQVLCEWTRAGAEGCTYKGSVLVVGGQQGSRWGEKSGHPGAWQLGARVRPPSGDIGGGWILSRGPRNETQAGGGHWVQDRWQSLTPSEGSMRGLVHAVERQGGEQAEGTQVRVHRGVQHAGLEEEGETSPQKP